MSDTQVLMLILFGLRLCCYHLLCSWRGAFLACAPGLHIGCDTPLVDYSTVHMQHAATVGYSSFTSPLGPKCHVGKLPMRDESKALLETITPAIVRSEGGLKRKDQ